MGGIVISRNFVLSPQLAEDDNKPLIGWQNVVTFGGIDADTEASGYPATNLANPQTFSRWQAANTSGQYLTFETGTVEDIDYVAVARHNLCSAAIPVSIEGRLGGGDYVELVQDGILPSDGPALFRFAPQPLTNLRIRFQSGNSPASIAVVYIGKLIVMERKIWVGQTPMPLGRKSTTTNGRSESGEFLGRIVLSEWTETKVPLSLFAPDWYRRNMMPFLTAASDQPFFFAWRPQDYPYEVAYAWLTNDAVPVNEGPSGLMALTLELGGIT